MQGNLESVEETFPKKDVIGVEHVNDIKSDVLCVRVLWGAESDW
jgi:hypothetical protein